MVQVTGFWKRQDEDVTEFDMLEKIVLGQIQGVDIDLMCFLHGNCSVFAIALYDRFGYPIYRCWDADEAKECGNPSIESESFPLIHDFCIGMDNEGFVDIRGITGEECKFFDEFEDFFTRLQYRRLSGSEIQTIKENCKRMVGSKVYSKLYQMCSKWIDEHSDDYKIKHM